MNASLVGTGAIARLALRRDRVRLVVWVVSIAALVLFSGQSIIELYPDGQGLAEYAVVARANQAVVAMAGPTHGIETMGGRIAFEVWFGGIATGLMALLTAVRHTRADEEAGRGEVLRSTVVGRHAPSAAAVLVASGASVAVGAATTAALLVLGLDASGSLVLGASFAALGIVFAAVGLVSAQVVEHSRAASGIALAVLGAAFLLRAIGDVTGNGMSWASPIGWMQATQPFAGDRWGPVVLSLVVALVVTAVAVVLEDHRDVGAGLVAARSGPPRAAAWLVRPLGLAWRLQRGALAGWAAGIVLMAVGMGAVAASADDFIGDNEAMADFLAQVGGAGITDLYLAMVISYIALLVGGFALQSVLRLRGEEDAGRADAVLATSISRTRWAASHLAIAVVGSVALLVGSGLGAGVAHALTTGEAEQVPRLVAASLVPLPAVLVLVGAATLLWGAAPRTTAVVWGLLAVCTVITMFGTVLDLPQWALDVSPFTHLPAAPAAGVEWLPLVVLTVVAATLAAAGLLAFHRRDVART